MPLVGGRGRAVINEDKGQWEIGQGWQQCHLPDHGLGHHLQCSCTTRVLGGWVWVKDYLSTWINPHLLDRGHGSYKWECRDDTSLASCTKSDLKVWEDGHDFHRCYSRLAVMLGDLVGTKTGWGGGWRALKPPLFLPPHLSPSVTDFWASSKVFSMAVIWLSLSL